jgi:deazaflavin-dependent oxidoreductase (nitroreductase family)
VKSGIEHISPLVPLLDGDRIFAFASKGGSDENPHWYGNLVAHPEVTVELGTETFPPTAKVLTGAEHDAIYVKQVAVEPQFGEYQRKTTRMIPVVELVRSGGSTSAGE